MPLVLSGQGSTIGAGTLRLSPPGRPRHSGPTPGPTGAGQRPRPPWPWSPLTTERGRARRPTYGLMILLMVHLPKNCYDLFVCVCPPCSAAFLGCGSHASGVTKASVCPEGGPASVCPEGGPELTGTLCTFFVQARVSLWAAYVCPALLPSLDVIAIRSRVTKASAPSEGPELTSSAICCLP